MAQVRFEPMGEAEFERYTAASIPAYAAEHVRAGTYPADGAVERARGEFASLLPQGLHTPGHTVVWILDAASGRRVGHLWYFRAADQPRMFVYDIEILPEARRQGFAEAALTDLAAIGHAAGAKHLALHVFGHNTGAIALYEKLGFATTNRMMAKPL